MAGFMKKLQGHVYNGAYPAGEKLPNGVFVAIVDDGTGKKVVKKLTKTADIVMRVERKELLWRKNAVVLEVQAQGNDEVFFVENELDFIPCCEWNTADFECPIGRKVKMKRVLNGEVLITTEIDDDVYAALEKDDIVCPGAGGKIVKKA